MRLTDALGATQSQEKLPSHLHRPLNIPSNSNHPIRKSSNTVKNGLKPLLRRRRFRECSRRQSIWCQQSIPRWQGEFRCPESTKQLKVNIPSYVQGKGGQQTLRPLTIKQVLEASQPHADADFLVDGVELGNVRKLSSHRFRSDSLILSPDQTYWGSTKHLNNSDERIVSSGRRNRNSRLQALAGHVQ